MSDVLQRKIEFDARTAKTEAENCARCKGITEIRECPNSMKGYRTVIRQYLGQPIPKAVECEDGKRLRAEHARQYAIGSEDAADSQRRRAQGERNK